MLFSSAPGTSPPSFPGTSRGGRKAGMLWSGRGASLGSAPARSGEEEEKPPGSVVPLLPTCAWSLASSPTKGFLLGRPPLPKAFQQGGCWGGKWSRWRGWKSIGALRGGNEPQGPRLMAVRGGTGSPAPAGGLSCRYLHRGGERSPPCGSRLPSRK